MFPEAGAQGFERKSVYGAPCGAYRQGLRASHKAKRAGRGFEEGQQISLNREQWSELYTLACDCEIADGGYYLPALFIRAIYLWLFGDPVEARRLFSETSKHFGWRSETNTKRIIVSEKKDGKLTPVSYKIKTYAADEKTLKAEIVSALNPDDEASFISTIKGRRDIFITPHMREYLYPEIGLQKPGFRERPVALHFNANGPRLGEPGSEVSK